MKHLETALHARLLEKGRLIETTVIPDGWLPDAALVADARWWAEQPLKVVEA